MQLVQVENKVEKPQYAISLKIQDMNHHNI